jgi:hemerythrin
MAKFEWDEKLKTGIEEIDAQHRDLIQRIDSLDVAIYGGKDKVELVMMLEYLESYVEKHFQAEEDLMIRIDYPGLADHVKEHREFEMTFKLIKQEYQSKGANSALARELDRKIVQWFEHHLLEVDAGYVEFLKKKS